MNWCKIAVDAVGWTVSLGVGRLVLWLVIDKGLWPWAAKKHGINRKDTSRLAWLVGMVERLTCTGALIIGGSHGWQVIAGWLANEGSEASFWRFVGSFTPSMR